MKKTFKLIKKQYKANEQIVLYIFFGVCTTAINTVCYWFLYEVLMLNNTVSTIMAWSIAVVYAFITNKVYVFKSKKTSFAMLANEIVAFFGIRVLTGVLDLVIMTIAVDMLKLNGLLWKLLSNFFVTITNYIASKTLIFKK